MSYGRRCLVPVVVTLLGVSDLRAEPPPQADRKPGAVAAPHTDLYGDPLPPGALARLGTTRFRHGSYGLVGLSFLPDGRTLIGATNEPHEILFWETETGRLLRKLSTGTLIVRGFALSPDGKNVAVAGFYPFEESNPPKGAVLILDVASGKELRNLPRDARDADQGTLAFTPDGKLIASMGGNGILRIEEVASGVEILQQQFPRDIAANLSMSPDGSILAVASGPNTHKLYLWKWQSGEEPSELEVPRYGASLLRFSPDGKTLAACGDHEGTIRMWDVASKQLRRTLIPPEHVSMSRGLAFSPDGKLLAVGDLGNRIGRNQSGAVILWDLVAGKIVRDLPTPGEPVGAVTISPDSHWVAAGGDSGVHVWELHTGEELAPSPATHHGNVTRLVVSAQGLIATASDDHTVRLWEENTGRQRLKLTHDNWVRGVALSPDGSKVASSGLDDTVRLWDTRTGREIYQLAGHGSMGGRRVLGFTSDGKRLLSWGDDYYLRIWDIQTGKALVENAIRPSGVEIPDEDAEPGMRMKLEMMLFGEAALSPDGRFFVLIASQDIFLFDATSGKELRKFAGDGGHVISLAISPDDKSLLTSSWGKPVITKLPDGRTSSSADKNHPITLWDLSTGQRIRQILLAGGGAGPVCFSPDGKLFAMATDQPQGRIRVMEVATGKERHPIEGLGGRVRCLAFFPDGKRLVSWMSDTTGLVWDLAREPGKEATP
jgi:WD40 repeat protein